MGKLDGKVAVITGAASGIGEATVRRFTEDGARVVIADIQDEKGSHLESELDERALYIHTDVTQGADIKAAIDFALEKFGRLDCIYNNAGIPGPDTRISDVDIDEYDQVLAVLLKSVFLGMKYAAPVLTAQHSGTIISTASVAGLQTGAAGHIYSAAKAGVIHLTRSVAKELGEEGVRVNCICPGGIATPIFGKAFGLPIEEADQTVDAMQQILAHSQPIPRSGQPIDIANAALWLASDESSFVNGHALVVDGGLIYGPTWSGHQKTTALMAKAIARPSRSQGK